MSAILVAQNLSFSVSWIFILSSDTGGNNPRAMLWFPAIAECGCNWMDGLSIPYFQSWFATFLERSHNFGKLVVYDMVTHVDAAPWPI